VISARQELLDAIDRTDPVFLAAVLVALYCVAIAIDYTVRWIRFRLAIERLQGYAHGYHDGFDRSMPAVNVYELPEAFARAYRR
jgi:hypothetical protein